MPLNAAVLLWTLKTLWVSMKRDYCIIKWYVSCYLIKIEKKTNKPFWNKHTTPTFLHCKKHINLKTKLWGIKTGHKFQRREFSLSNLSQVTVQIHRGDFPGERLFSLSHMESPQLAEILCIIRKTWTSKTNLRSNPSSNYWLASY